MSIFSELTKAPKCVEPGDQREGLVIQGTLQFLHGILPFFNHGKLGGLPHPLIRVIQETV